MLTRRDFLKTSALAGAGAMLFWKGGTLYSLPASGAPVALFTAAEILTATTIPKYETPLVIPPPMPRVGRIKVKGGKKDKVDYYEIAVKQFDQFILPNSMGKKTTVWSYGSTRHPGTFNYPAFTIEAEHDTPVRVKWINGLVDNDGKYLPHLLAVDQTLHWANPPGGNGKRDGHSHDPAPYRGPVPMVTHVHGAHTTEESDGFAESWYLPAAKDIDRKYAREGSKYMHFAQKFWQKRGVRWEDGSATFQYPNDQAATTLWYHDHTLGMTRVNVYAGPAGFYIIRGGPNDLADDKLPGPAPKAGDGPGKSYYEIPIVIQDRSFNRDGSLFYPDNRAFFEGLTPEQLQIPFIGDKKNPSDVPPIWNPEFFGETMVVNGKTWPTLNVEPRRYRFRLLNGCNARFLLLKLTRDTLKRPGESILDFWQIGADGGFLPAPAPAPQLLMAPAERADVIVDFSGLEVGTEVYLINEGPDSPFGGLPEDPAELVEDLADPNTTGQIMRFVVVALKGEDESTSPDALTLGAVAPAPLGDATFMRQVSLNEASSEKVFVVKRDDGSIVMVPKPDANQADIVPVVEPFGPIAAQLGTVEWKANAPMGMPMMWVDKITETPEVDVTEVWEIYNFTMDAHPIHIHQTQFQVVDRQQLNMQTGPVAGTEEGPQPAEFGFKDTVIAYPDQVTRIKARFDLPGLFVWHCHIVEHEDNEMMRPFRVGSVMQAADALDGEATEDVGFEEEGATNLFMPFVTNQ